MPNIAGMVDGDSRKLSHAVSNLPDPFFTACIWGFPEVLKSAPEDVSKSTIQALAVVRCVTCEETRATIHFQPAELRVDH